MNTDATLTWVPDLGSSDHGSSPARLAAAALSACSCSLRWTAAICASSLLTSASEGAPGAGRKAAGTGWAGGIGRPCWGAGGASAVEAPVVEAPVVEAPVVEAPVVEGAPTATVGLPPAMGDGAVGADVRALCATGTAAPGAEAPQPAVSGAMRSSATAAAPGAPLGRRDPDIRGLWASHVSRVAAARRATPAILQTHGAVARLRARAGP